ncbi:hypothetical protein [Streptomyces sp. A3M-1-3]|uniref:hypothetical protein n=1 Tax=Streptomyces sp. A3M-1-3 TaxID=2962044 RepID=UPI0027E4BED1|nr:hypothetical protein [Streptomyces sp. A3M-1-3]
MRRRGTRHGTSPAAPAFPIWSHQTARAPAQPSRRAVLAIARVEVHPYSRWASPAGQRLLGCLSGDSAGDDREFLTAVAVHGVAVVRDPALRAALSGGGRSGHRGR